MALGVAVVTRTLGNSHLMLAEKAAINMVVETTSADQGSSLNGDT
jgi:hypothetical protein